MTTQLEFASPLRGVCVGCCELATPPGTPTAPGVRGTGATWRACASCAHAFASSLRTSSDTVLSEEAMLTSSPRADAAGLAGGRATGGGAAAGGTITFTTGAGFPALGATATDAGVDVGALTGAATTVGALEAAVPDLWVVVAVVVAAARVEGAEDAEDAEGGAADTAGDAAKIGALDGDDGGGGGGGGVGRGGAAGGDRTAPNTAGRRGGTGGGMGGGGTAGGRGVASPGRCSGGTGSGCAHAAVGEAKSTNSANAGLRSASTSASRPVMPLPSTSTKYLRGTGEHHPRRRAPVYVLAQRFPHVRGVRWEARARKVAQLQHHTVLQALAVPVPD